MSSTTFGSAPSIGVIIPTHQRRESLNRTLDSLARQTAPTDLYEVVVALDRCTDGTRELLERQRTPYDLHVVASSGCGRAAACNAALPAVRGDVVIILDDDMQVVPEFVDRHQRHHPRGSRRCVLGAVPVVLDDMSPLAARYVRAKFDAHLARLAEPGHAYVPRDFYSGNVSLRLEVLRSVGGFDESFTAYGNEDIELWVRLAAAGVSFRFDPQARALQEYHKDLRALAADTTEKGRTAVTLARAHAEVFPALQLAAPLDHSRPWLSLRAVLLAATRRWTAVRGPIFTFASLLERLGLWRQPLFYRAILDYAYWTGVDAELATRATENELADLAGELHRGPLDLLLRG
jgi:GT2 family glycosyltransferase